MKTIITIFIIFLTCSQVLLGQEVKTLINKHQSPGVHNVIWDGRNNKDLIVSSGIYFYELNVGYRTWYRKMIFLR